MKERENGKKWKAFSTWNLSLSLFHFDLLFHPLSPSPYFRFSLPLFLPSSILLLDMIIDPLETFIDTCDDGNQSRIYWNKEQNDEFLSLFHFLSHFLFPSSRLLFIGSKVSVIKKEERREVRKKEKKEKRKERKRRFTNTVSNLLTTNLIGTENFHFVWT